MNLKKILILSLILLAKQTLADDSTPDYSQNLTGDWSKNRIKLFNSGVDFILNYYADSFNNLSGGIKTGSGILSTSDLKINLDGEKLYGIEGSKALIELISITGNRPNQQWIGSLVQVDNSEPNTSITRIEQAWISQEFFESKINILAGLYDIGNDFYITNSAGIFIQPSFGIGNEIAQTTTNGINIYGASTFPEHSIGTKVKFTPNDTIYFQAAIMDALLKNNSNVNDVNTRISKHNGAMFIAETGTTSSYGNYSIGVWQFSKKFPALLNQQTLKSNSGYYLMGEKSLYKQDARELFGFIRYGVADGRVVQINQMLSLGLTLNGAIKERDNSKLGFGISKAYIGRDYVQSVINNGQDTHSSETSFELTYSDKITSWLRVQPDLQYIPNPTLNPVNAGSPYLKSATLAMLRINIEF